jgi:hypothetical protein
MLLFAQATFAQAQYILYGLDNVPQSNHLNPAAIPDAKMVIGIPFLSSLSLSAYSTGFSFNDLFTEQGDSLYFNLDPLVTSSDEMNYLTAFLDMDIIYFGYKIKKGYLNVGIRHRIYARAFYATDLVKLAWYGNNAYVGEDLDMSPTWVNADEFNSWYAGYAFPIGKYIEMGVRFNINQGLSNIQTSKSEISLRTIEDEESVYKVHAQTNYQINTSNLNGTSTGHYIFDFNNFGISLDFGATFQVHEQVQLSLSVLDLGYISWESNITSYKSAYEEVTFTGVYADPDVEDEDVFQKYSDSLKSLFEPVESSFPYSATLPARILVGAAYSFKNDANRASFLFSGRMMHGYFEPSVTLAYDMKVSRVFSFKTSYTYLKYSPFNLGLGIVIEARPFHFYVMTDNIIAPFNLFGTKYANIHFGFNLIWPRNKEE